MKKWRKDLTGIKFFCLFCYKRVRYYPKVNILTVPYLKFSKYEIEGLSLQLGVSVLKPSGSFQSLSLLEDASTGHEAQASHLLFPYPVPNEKGQPQLCQSLEKKLEVNITCLSEILEHL